MAFGAQSQLKEQRKTESLLTSIALKSYLNAMLYGSTTLKHILNNLYIFNFRLEGVQLKLSL
jgi:hypothetical protein